MHKHLDVHVVPAGSRRRPAAALGATPSRPTGRWRVTHAALTLSSHRTQRAAVAAGVRVAKRNRLELVTHARNGRFRSKDSYGHESDVHDREH